MRNCQITDKARELMIYAINDPMNARDIVDIKHWIDEEINLKIYTTREILRMYIKDFLGIVINSVADNYTARERLEAAAEFIYNYMHDSGYID